MCIYIYIYIYIYYWNPNRHPADPANLLSHRVRLSATVGEYWDNNNNNDNMFVLNKNK